MNNKYYVYALIDPKNNTPFYIGKGSGNREKAHLAEAHQSKKNWVNFLKCQRILSIEKRGMKVGFIRLYESLTEAEAYEKEETEISKWGKIIDGTGCLTNLSDGGLGGSGVGKHISCYSPAGDLVKSFVSLDEGAIFAGIHKSTVCAALNKRTKLAGGYRWAYEGNDVDLTPRVNTSPVVKYNLQGNKLKEYQSMSEAARDIKITYTTIVECCMGRHEVVGGFRWAYKGQELMPLRNSIEKYLPKKFKAINPKTNVVVGIFNNLTEAVENTDANTTGIIDSCAGRKKHSGGLKWERVFD